MDRIDIDINGGTGPNTYGKDVFVLERVHEEGKSAVVLPWGAKLNNDTINLNCSITGDGRGCAEKIKRAGWKIDKSYPW